MASTYQISSGKMRTLAYWIVTLLVVFENAAGFVWAALHIGYLHVMLTHLGYPQYFMNIIGVWQLACAATLIAPRFPLVKEWAYAGAFFNYSSAFISHVAVGDRADRWAAPLLFAVFTIASWALRPADRRLSRSTTPRETRPLSWVVPIAILILMIIISLFTLPKTPTF
jgi:DoxX-like protein